MKYLESPWLVIPLCIILFPIVLAVVAYYVTWMMDKVSDLLFKLFG